MSPLAFNPAQQMQLLNPVAQRILASARQHFMAHGFKNVTMDDLAAEIGMSKKTLYAHFPSKAVLLKSVLTQKLDEAERTLENILSEKADDFIGALHELAVHIQKQTGEAQPVFVRDLSREEPALADYLIARRRQIVEKTFVKLLACGRDAGHVRTDIPIEFQVEMFLAVLETIAVPKHLAAHDLTLTECLNRILSTFLKGVLTEKGRHNL
ncbi:MAG: TetR/AcrR family transcriptional regulator [Verrucomicrobia bacterium]|nr:TetR/AcrR family transcriptional regulator [Verrucomicrobiota bacterium]